MTYCHLRIKLKAYSGRSDKRKPWDHWVVSNTMWYGCCMPTKINEYGGWIGLILYSLLTAVISSAITGVIIKWVLDKDFASWESQRSWKTAALYDVVAPAMMQLEKTNAIANRYRKTLLYGDAISIRNSNLLMSNTLLSKSHLLPSDLVVLSQCLIVHYDIWLRRFDFALEKYKQDNNGLQPSPITRFDIGFSEFDHPICGDFPNRAPVCFSLYYDKLREELYDIKATTRNNIPAQERCEGIARLQPSAGSSR